MLELSFDAHFIFIWFKVKRPAVQCSLNSDAHWSRMKASRSKSPKHEFWISQYFSSKYFYSEYIFIYILSILNDINLLFVSILRSWKGAILQFYCFSSILGHFWLENGSIIKLSQRVAKKSHLNSFTSYLRSLWCKNLRDPKRLNFVT